MKILEEAFKYSPQITEWRREFHQYPEIGFEVTRTAGRVAELLKEFGLDVRQGFAKTAVLGILDTGKPGRTIAVRADMDALGMQDEIEKDYKSKVDGVCHACGHDAHTALVLGLAKFMADHRENICGTIKFIFQPAEEGPAPGGAKLIMESGVLDDVDVIIGAHAQPLYQAGEIGVKYGEAFASGDFFNVKIKGSGCHAASPHRGNDVIMTAVSVIDALQKIVSREVPPLKTAVLSVCSIQGGKAGVNNVLPEQVTFGGTFRAHEDEVRNYIAGRVEQVVKSICQLNGCEYEYTDNFMFPPFSNDTEVIDTIYRSAAEVLGENKVIKKPDPEMGSEDFAYYTKKIKAAFFFFGIRNEKKDCVYSLHNPRFDIDEDTFGPTLAVFVNTVYHLLEQEV